MKRTNLQPKNVLSTSSSTKKTFPRTCMLQSISLLHLEKHVVIISDILNYTKAQSLIKTQHRLPKNSFPLQLISTFPLALLPPLTHILRSLASEKLNFTILFPISSHSLQRFCHLLVIVGHFDSWKSYRYPTLQISNVCQKKDRAISLPSIFLPLSSILPPTIVTRYREKKRLRFCFGSATHFLWECPERAVLNQRLQAYVHLGEVATSLINLNSSELSEDDHNLLQAFEDAEIALHSPNIPEESVYED